jgi:hypothetical protein
MKNHFQSLFDSTNRWRTISFFVSAILLIVVAALVGISDNLPGILLLLGGMIILFFSFLHIWRKVENYAMLIGVCVGIIILVLLGIQILVWLKKTEYISEAVVMIIAFLICLPGILTGIIGSIINSFRKK